MILEHLINEADYLFFARNTDCTEETMMEVMRDFRIFEAKIDRMVKTGELKGKIGLKLIERAGKVDRVPEALAA
jgi:hypothetical protein